MTCSHFPRNRRSSTREVSEKFQVSSLPGVGYFPAVLVFLKTGVVFWSACVACVAQTCELRSETLCRKSISLQKNHICGRVAGTGTQGTHSGRSRTPYRQTPGPSRGRLSVVCGCVVYGFCNPLSLTEYCMLLNSVLRYSKLYTSYLSK